MRFLTLYAPDAGKEVGSKTPEQMAALGKYSEDMSKAGRLISQAMFDPECAKVRLQAGKVTVTQEREQIVGYAFIEASSKEEAIEGAKEFMAVAGDGVTVVRQVLEGRPS